MSKLMRELVSRLTALVGGLAMLYGGWRCLAMAVDFGADAHRAAALPFMVGAILLILGFPLTLFAIVPPGLMEAVFRPAAPKSGENGVDDAEASMWWKLFHWW